MLQAPNCFDRNCIHYEGVKWLTDDEESEINYCQAFPNGIPDEIAYGTVQHTQPVEGQGNNIVYEGEPNRGGKKNA